MLKLCAAAAGMLVTCLSAHAAEKVIAFHMIDLYPEEHNGQEHVVGIALDGNGHLVMKDHVVRKLPDGSFAGTCTYVLDDGSSITSEFTMTENGEDFSADYNVVSGTGAFSGSHGQGHLITLKGFEGASSSTGVYQVKLVVTTP